MTQWEGTEPGGPVKTPTQPVSGQRNGSCKRGRSRRPLWPSPRPRAHRRICTFRGPRVGGVRGVAADAAVQGAAETPALEHGQREPPHAGFVVELPALRHDAALHVPRALLAHETRVDPCAGGRESDRAAGRPMGCLSPPHHRDLGRQGSPGGRAVTRVGRKLEEREGAPPRAHPHSPPQSDRHPRTERPTGHPRLQGDPS